ncbi:glycoside hydrolase family 3 protein [Mediterraneibacter massiliensis]|uniref:glycoside hydrolase family 3 protein n=1 Tax=Mediterraneibacter massiliensis TaxID=1720300 RepID=UPI0024ADA03A|nr:glycoside hydrolase family 3 protein [Mediterraneibacter massiliensis]
MKTDKGKKKQDKKRKFLIFAAVLLCLICIAVIGMSIREIIEKSAETSSVGSRPKTTKDSGHTQEKRPEKKENEEIQQPKKSVSEAERILLEMTVEEKAAQLFIITPETLTQEEVLTQAGDVLQNAFASYPVGGFIMMQGNIVSPEQITELNHTIEGMSINAVGLKPFLAVDEEGGTVARIAGNETFPVENRGNMSDVGSTGDPMKAYETGAYIGGYLAEYGFNLDFAPDADIWLNPENTVVRYRSFGSDVQLVSDMTAAAVRGFHSAGICTALKHFPGHGGTAEDSHEGFAYAARSLEELRECEFLPFQAGIEAGSEFVMIGHITVPEITGEGTPATLSGNMVTDILRKELGYEGIIVTDAMNMGAISANYSSDTAAAEAVKAGVDMILMPADFYGAYEGILSAVASGEISEKRLDESVKRIIELKLKL